MRSVSTENPQNTAGKRQIDQSGEKLVLKKPNTAQNRQNLFFTTYILHSQYFVVLLSTQGPLPAPLPCIYLFHFYNRTDLWTDKM